MLNKVKLVTFLLSLKSQPQMLSLMNQVQRRLLVAQRCIKLFLKRRKLTYAFNCRNWVITEVEVLRDTKKLEQILRVDQVSYTE